MRTRWFYPLAAALSLQAMNCSLSSEHECSSGKTCPPPLVFRVLDAGDSEIAELSVEGPCMECVPSGTSGNCAFVEQGQCVFSVTMTDGRTGSATTEVTPPPADCCGGFQQAWVDITLE
jgi:hypothetical protein